MFNQHAKWLSISNDLSWREEISSLNLHHTTIALGSRTEMTAIPRKEIAPLIRVTVQNWLNDRAPWLGAALAFYLALSLAPTLVILLAIAGLAFGAKAAEGRLILEIQGLVGYEGAKVIQAMIEGAHRPRSGIGAILLGLVPLFIGATAAVSELKDALNTIWRVPDDKTSSTVRSMFNVVKERFLSFVHCWLTYCPVKQRKNRGTVLQYLQLRDIARDGNRRISGTFSNQSTPPPNS
jgi:hypothetical protein